MTIISKHDVTKIISVSKNREVRSLINLVVETLKNFGIGADKDKQLIEYNEKELKILKKISEFILWIYNNESSGFRTKKESIICKGCGGQDIL